MSNERDATENDDRANPDGWCSLQDTIDRLLMFADGTMPIAPTRSEADRADLLAVVGRLEQLQRIADVIGDDPDDLPWRLSESAAAVPMLFPEGEDEEQCDVADAASYRMTQAARVLRRIAAALQGRAPAEVAPEPVVDVVVVVGGGR